MICCHRRQFAPICQLNPNQPPPPLQKNLLLFANKAQQPIYLNGLNGSTGQALDDFQLTTEQLAKVARQKRLSPEELREAHDQRTDHRMGVIQKIDIASLAMGV